MNESQYSGSLFRGMLNLVEYTGKTLIIPEKLVFLWLWTAFLDKPLIICESGLKICHFHVSDFVGK